MSTPSNASTVQRQQRAPLYACTVQRQQATFVPALSYQASTQATFVPALSYQASTVQRQQAIHVGKPIAQPLCLSAQCRLVNCALSSRRCCGCTLDPPSPGPRFAHVHQLPTAQRRLPTKSWCSPGGVQLSEVAPLPCSRSPRSLLTLPRIPLLLLPLPSQAIVAHLGMRSY
eukprot:1144677-Pelagomonas_calceolata.AAC.4